MAKKSKAEIVAAYRRKQLKRFIRNLVGGIIGILILVFTMTGIVFFKTTDQYDTLSAKVDYFKQYVLSEADVMKGNARARVSPPRRRPLSLLHQQDELKQLSPGVFRHFSRQDWEIFWKMIYGQKEEGSGLIKQVRYRTKAEIERYLSSKYENEFNLRNKTKLSKFWEIIKLDRGFRHVIYDEKGNMKVERGNKIQVP